MNDATAAEIRQFLLDSLTEMNYSTDDIDDDTALGPAGADLESLSLAELAVRVEDRFGVRFDDDEAEKLAGMTVGEFIASVAERLAAAATAGS
ncbi:phosphopantetheine-binding protein [Dactylosporangium sp. AC04546]|uniref:acyl carrier protein n=1 Tax=Dactylosporangium sp. AC04546 TaxID=2862460 RepID=UPI001EDCBA7F|nr:phosphopantetheine-binding protein [Dactylosporangium sp. AC04546]WVK86199.1 phosphopantetheine-binding protein [Dactylosporangium sp. AC04546]